MERQGYHRPVVAGVRDAAEPVLQRP
jgi:hypothetical protein